MKDMIKGYGEEMDNRSTHWRDTDFDKKAYFKNYIHVNLSSDSRQGLRPTEQ